MKKILMLLLLCFTLSNAKKQELLNLEPSEDFYPNLSTQICNTNCLFDLLENRLYLSFLSEFGENNSEILANIYAKLLNSITDFDKNLQKSIPIKLAIIIPEKTIKSYSNIIINSSFAYLLRQRAQIKVKVFLIGTEDTEKIQQTLEQIENQNYKFAIAGLTLKGLNALHSYKGSLKIFIPSIHKNTAKIHNPNIYFGGLDYDLQLDTLLEKANDDLVIFTDSSAISSNLNSKILAKRENVRIYKIEGEKLDFAKLFKTQGSLSQSSIIFNSSLVKTALASSQLRIYGINPYVLLSSQINYNPTFLSLTQVNDRKHFLVANSIDLNDENLSYLNEVFNQNIHYNAVAYATSIGLDYFYTNFLNSKTQNIFQEEIKDFQVLYKVYLMKALDGSFQSLK